MLNICLQLRNTATRHITLYDCLSKNVNLSNISFVMRTRTFMNLNNDELIQFYTPPQCILRLPSSSHGVTDIKVKALMRKNVPPNENS